MKNKKRLIVTFNGTMQQARELVRSIQAEQAKKERKKKLEVWFGVKAKK